MRRNNNKQDGEVKQKRRKQGKENSELSKGVEIANRAVKKEKNRREKDRKKEEKRESRKSNKKIKKYIIIFTVTILAILFIKYRHILGITFSREITSNDCIVIENTTSDNKIYPYRNEILLYSKGKLLTYSRYGKKTWEYNFDETFIPDISIKGNYIQVANKDNGYIYVFNNKYESTRKKINGTIKKASINAKGESVVHYSKEGVKSNIGVYDKKGNEKYSITLSSDNIAKVDISDNGRYVLLYEVDTEGISVNSVLKVVDLKMNDKVETILEVKNDVIYDVLLNNSNIYVLTSSKTYICNIAKKSTREFDITGKNISNIAIDNSGVAYIAKEISEDNNTLTILNSMYKQVGRCEFNGAIKEVIYDNYLAYTVGSKDIEVYNLWGMCIKKFKSNTLVAEPVIFNNGKNVAINYSNKIIVFGI